MRIRTANGRLLAGGRLWAVLVIVMVVLGGSAFGQQKQSGKISSKKGGTASERRTIVPVPDARIMNNTPPEYRLPEIPVEAPRSDNPVPPFNGAGWSPPPFVLPGMPNAPNSGILPGRLPSPGALPPSDPPPVDCEVFCTCQISRQRNENSSSVADCSIPDYTLYVISITKTYTKRSFHNCQDVNKTDVCAGNGGAYTGYKLLFTSNRHSGCDNSELSSYTHRQGDAGLPPTSFGMFTSLSDCNGRYLP